METNGSPEDGNPKARISFFPADFQVNHVKLQGFFVASVYGCFRK